MRIRHAVWGLLLLTLSAHSVWAEQHVRENALEAKGATTALPCDLSALKIRPTLLLIGEDHTDTQSIATREAFLRLAAEGKLFAGREGVFFGDQDNHKRLNAHYKTNEKVGRIYGYDDAFTYGFSTVSLRIWQLRQAINEAKPAGGNEVDAVTQVKGSFIVDLLALAPLREAWKTLPRPFINKRLEQLAKSVDTLITSTQRWTDLINDYPNDHVFHDHDLFIQLEREVAKKYRELSRTKWTDAQVPEEHFRLAQEVADLDSVPTRSMDAFLEKVVLQARNPPMAKALLQLYCRAAREEKPLVAIAGALHVEGLHDLLETASKGEIPVVLGDSRKESFDELLHKARTVRTKVQVAQAPRGQELTEEREFLSTQPIGKLNVAHLIAREIQAHREQGVSLAQLYELLRSEADDVAFNPRVSSFSLVLTFKDGSQVTFLYPGKPPSEANRGLKALLSSHGRVKLKLQPQSDPTSPVLEAKPE